MREAGARVTQSQVKGVGPLGAEGVGGASQGLWTERPCLDLDLGRLVQGEVTVYCV